MKKTVEPSPNNKFIKARDGDSKPNFQPETSHKKAVSIYGGSSKVNSPSRTSNPLPQQSKKHPVVVRKKITKTASTTNQANKETKKPVKKGLDKELLSILPPEIVLEILDYYVGPGFKVCLNPVVIPTREIDLNSLKFDESLFYKQYFGKFTNRGTDTAPKLIFKRAAVVSIDDRRSATEYHRLLTIMTSLNLPIDDYFRTMCWLNIVDRRKAPTDLEERISKRLTYISNVFEKDKSLCEKVTKIDLQRLETFESAVEFGANNFPNLEIVRLGYTNMPTKGYMYQKSFSMAEASDSICKIQNMKEFAYLGDYFSVESMEKISKSTPKLQKLIIESSVSIGKCGNFIGNWQELKEVNVSIQSSYSRSIEVAIGDEQTEFLKALSDLKIEKLTVRHDSICLSTFNRLPSTLTFLDLEHTKINSQLFEGISELVSLKSLYLDCTRGHERDDFKYLKNLPNLELLSVTQSSTCGDIGTKHISMITSLKKVFLLNLSQDQIHDESGMTLSNLPNLEEIDLQYCEITEKTINSIVKKCNNISKIYINGCKKINKAKLLPNIKHLLDEYSFYRIRHSVD
ncbi:predicted protein [Naegleria gruberi]|uniref:Predicted protein n=1 Tax=Naegleria gruberi TaxID=5762 RepID=D2VIU0_NAEGR|nr:uncharacterized protein NAEGRDRAFT_68795 [Naegleria gruberi]EFC43410.1 predicted protein [Naegleria gruberi]|eukprot:XP_002676154.1 predicted protein [Naegleria gruberi strain NEG-M]